LADEIICAFCKCQLAPNGKLVDTSDRADELREGLAASKRLTTELKERDDVIVALKEQIKKLKESGGGTPPQDDDDDDEFGI